MWKKSATSLGLLRKCSRRHKSGKLVASKNFKSSNPVGVLSRRLCFKNVESGSSRPNATVTKQLKLISLSSFLHMESKKQVKRKVNEIQALDCSCLVF